MGNGFKVELNFHIIHGVELLNSLGEQLLYLGEWNVRKSEQNGLSDGEG